MWNVLDGQDNIVEQTASQIEAFGVIDWLTANDHTSGPFHCAPAELVSA